MFGKKFLINLLTLIFVLPLAFGLVGCGPKIEITLDKNEVVLEETCNTTIVATVTEDSKTVSSDQLVWESSNTAVATVDNGLVTAVGVGSANITCSYKGQSANCSVQVNEIVYVEISTAEEFYVAMMSGENRAYKLLNDITFTDKTFDSSSEYQSGEYFFDVDFTGILNGNRKKIFFNLENRSLNTTFNGVFKSIAGTIKLTNFIIYVQTYYNSGDEKGILTPLLTGNIDQCIITYDTYRSSRNNVATPILEMGANAEISRTIIRRERRTAYYDYSRLCQYQLVKYAQSTSKITNVAILGSRWGNTGNSTSTSQIAQALPTTKCNVNGFWLFTPYATSGNVENEPIKNLKLGAFSYGLVQERYADASTPANVTKAGADITAAEVSVLYNSQNPWNGIQYPTVAMNSVFGYGVSNFLMSAYRADYNTDHTFSEKFVEQDILVLEFFG